jgi:hypothetical protein
VSIRASRTSLLPPVSVLSLDISPNVGVAERGEDKPRRLGVLTGAVGSNPDTLAHLAAALHDAFVPGDTAGGVVAARVGGAVCFGGAVVVLEAERITRRVNTAEAAAEGAGGAGVGGVIPTLRSGTGVCGGCGGGGGGGDTRGGSRGGAGCG